MTVSFSNDGVEAISRRLDSIIVSSRNDIDIYYELNRCKHFILNNDYKKIALQFPDNLLCDSTRVVSKLQEETGREIFILGDTSYGSCCVDEVAAEHGDADCLIHFGPSCLTRTKRLPVLYVFGREEVEVGDCVRCFREAFPSLEQRVLVLYDTPYHHCMAELRENLVDYTNCVLSDLALPTSSRKTTPPQEAATTDRPISSSGVEAAADPAPPTLPPRIDLNSLSCSCDRTTCTSEVATSASSAGLAPLTSAANSTHIPGTVPPSVTSSGTTSSSSCSTISSSNRDNSRSSCDGSGCHTGTSSCVSCVTPHCCGERSQTERSTERSTVPYCGDRVSSERRIDRGISQDDCNQDSPHFHQRFGRLFQLPEPVEDYCMFYIGREGPTLTNFILNYSKCQFVSYDPRKKLWRRESISVNKTLGKRYYLVQRAKEARSVGIIVGTLGAADYLRAIERLKKVLKLAGKNFYTIAVGKLNVPKIANFLEIDIFVLVACPENSLLESQEFFKPVVTPYEMELACLRCKEWTGEYSTDYQDILPGACFYTDLKDEEVVRGEEMEPEFSLITGELVSTETTSGHVGEGESMAVQARSKMEVAERNSAMAYLQNRSWQGLEQKLGESEVGVAVEGRSGIAAEYENELH